jgi:hypothetical protein
MSTVGPLPSEFATALGFTGKQKHITVWQRKAESKLGHYLRA